MLEFAGTGRLYGAISFLKHLKYCKKAKEN